MPVPEAISTSWEENSTYIKLPPYFENMPKSPGRWPTSEAPASWLCSATASTTDHISPAGSIAVDSPAENILSPKGVKPHEFIPMARAAAIMK